MAECRSKPRFGHSDGELAIPKDRYRAEQVGSLASRFRRELKGEFGEFDANFDA